MLSDAAIRDAAELLASAARGPVRMILFGSHARGDAGPTSDLDLLVIDKHDAGHFDRDDPTPRRTPAARGPR